MVVNLFPKLRSVEVKDTYKYHMKKGGKIVHRGITTDLAQQEIDHQNAFSDARIWQVGRRTTHKAAVRWERAGGRRRYRI